VGTAYLQLRGARKQRRKRYGRYDSRGRLTGKRAIADRPAAATTRTVVGHWEGDTVLAAHFPRRTRPGETPMKRLKARLNAASDW
jgi:IS30 family transposase